MIAFSTKSSRLCFVKFFSVGNDFKNQGINQKFMSTAIISHIEEKEIHGGTSVSNAWVTRKLNTIESENPLFTLENNIITIPKGRWYINVQAVAYNASAHCIRIYDVDEKKVLTEGICAYDSNSWAVFFLDTETSRRICIDHYATIGSPITGFGMAMKNKPSTYCNCVIYEV